MNCRVTLAVALFFCTWAPPAGAVATFTGIGDLAGGTVTSSASAVSADGTTVVGLSNSTSGSEAIRWTSGGGIVGLSDLAGGSFSSGATGVSADGSVIVGYGNSASGQEAFRWTSGGGMLGLGDLDGGIFQSQASGVSADGSVIVGHGFVFAPSGSATQPYRWTAASGMINLGFLPNGFNTNATGTSADGSVVVGYGYTDTNFQSVAAMRWTAAGGLVSLGQLPGGSDRGNANAVSADGTVIVGNSLSSLGNEAFRWTAETGMIPLGDLSGGTFNSGAAGVSERGAAIVGTGQTASGSTAFYWDALGGMQNLQTLLASDFGISLPAGWTLTSASAITPDGRVIVGSGTNPAARPEGWVVDLRDITVTTWGATASGSWDSGGSWKYGFMPRTQDNVLITPATGLVATGPAAAKAVESLTVNATTSGITEFRPQNTLTATSGVTVETAGRIVLTGQQLDAGTGLTINGGGSVRGYGIVYGPIGGTTGVAGILPTTRSLVLTEPLAVGSRQARILSTGIANLGPEASIAGGTITAPNGIFVGGAATLTGYGTVNGRISAGFGSTIAASGGDLTIGSASSVAGYTSDGELYTSANTVTINDANEAVLGSLTTLGDGASGGTLVAGTAVPMETRTHFLIEQGKNLVGRGNVVGNVKNHGAVIGDGTAMSERIVFDAGWTVSGIGDFQNVLFNGTFAPGLSPGVTTGANQAFGGVIEIELGGTTPGMGSGHHDQILDQATVELVDGVDLKILPWNGFVPTLGDTFEILRSAENLIGRFDQLLVDPYFMNRGIEFELQYGADSLSLLAVAPGLDGDFNADGIVDAADYAVWRNGLGSTYTQADYNTWRANFGATAPRGGSSTSTAAPEPGTALLVVFAAIGMTLAQRRHTRREAIE